MIRRPPTILLVDDDPNDEEFSRISLESIGLPYSLVVKRDGAEALEWLSHLEGPSHTSWPAFIVLDLKLPKVGGLEVLAHVRDEARTRLIPIIVFTSSSETRDLQKSYDLGANAYIRKPVDFTDYRKAVEDMGRFWMLRNQPPPQSSEAV
jgi:two-component system response regulator